MSDLVGYYRDGNTDRGPFSPSDLRRLVSEGRITASTLVRRGKDGQWIEAKRVHGLFPKVSETTELRDGDGLPQNAPSVTLAEESGHSSPPTRTMPANDGANPIKPTAFEMICGECRGSLLVQHFGVVVACPHCGAHLSIPTPEGSIPPSPEPASHARKVEFDQSVIAAEKADERGRRDVPDADSLLDPLEAASKAYAAAGSLARGMMYMTKFETNRAVEASIAPNQFDCEGIARWYRDATENAEAAAMASQAVANAAKAEGDSIFTRKIILDMTEDAMKWREQAKETRGLSDQRNVATYIAHCRKSQPSGCGMALLAIAAFVTAFAAAFS